MTRWAIACLLLASCDLGLRHDAHWPPRGEYRTVNVTDGSLRVSQGTCAGVDLQIIQVRADVAIANMRAVWQQTYPTATITVEGLPVVMSANLSATGSPAAGLYWPEHWIELRCDNEDAIEPELYHAIGHRLRIPCWATIGHRVDLDCSPI